MGCIFAEFLLKEPLFKGRSEIDQINQIFKVHSKLFSAQRYTVVVVVVVVVVLLLLLSGTGHAQREDLAWVQQVTFN